MRNPFRKKSPEEEFVDSFLKGMRETMSSVGNSQEDKDMYALIKARRDEGDYVAAQKLANDFVRAATAALRAEKDREFYEGLESLRKSE